MRYRSHTPAPVVIAAALLLQPGGLEAQNRSVDVNVTGIASGAAVGISPSANTVKIDGTTPIMLSEPSTTVLFDKSLTPSPGTVNVGPIDVSGAKQIRVVIVVIQQFANVTVTPKLNLPGGVSVPLDSQIAVSATQSLNAFTKTYDIVAQSIGFDLAFLSPVGSCRIVVYGRPN